MQQDLLFSAFNEVQLKFEGIMSTNSTVYEKIQELLDRQCGSDDEHLKKLEEVDEKFTKRLDALESKIIHLESSWADVKNIKEQISQNNNSETNIDDKIRQDDTTTDTGDNNTTTHEINEDEVNLILINFHLNKILIN